MELAKLLKGVADAASKHSPAIFTALGIAGFGATIVMTAKASPPAMAVHEDESARRQVRREILENNPGISEADEDHLKEEIKESYIIEAKDLAPLLAPPAIMGCASVACFLMANKINMDRQAAVMAAYSLSEKTLSTYQQKVIEKLGEEKHKEILDETSKEIARAETPDGFNHETYLVQPGMVRVYDNVTGRYFFSTKEKIMEAESAINKRLLNETRVPLQELYYELGLEEHFHIGDVMGWDISSPYMMSENTLNIWFTPMLDDDKNPCLALNYHVLIFDRSV